MTEPEYLTPQKAANMLAVSTSTIRRWADAGLLGDTIRQGARATRLIPRDAVLRAARGRPQTGIVRRRICWPEPDATCLHGGCGYCNMSPMRSLMSIRRYAATAGVVPHRGLGEDNALTAFEYGLRNQFFNAEVEWAERESH